MLNEKFQIQLTDFGTAKRVITGSASNNSRSTVSDISYLSGLSAVSQAQVSQTGNSNSSHEEDFDELVGSEHYISPEMVIAKQYSYASDLWALGVIVYQLLTGQVPFKGKTQELTFDLIKKGEFTIPDFVEDSAKDLIMKLLVKTPNERLGAQNIDELLMHPFFEGIDFNTIKEQTPPAS